MKKNDMMLWMSKGVTAEEAIKLSNAGFTPDMLDDSKKTDKKEESEGPEESKELKEPVKKEPKELEPDPRDSEIEKLKKEIADLQKSNRHQDFSGGEKVKTDLDIAKEIAAKLF